MNVPFSDVWFRDIDFGTMAVGWGEELPLFWVSRDAERWIELQAPQAGPLAPPGGKWQGTVVVSFGNSRS